MKVFFRRIHLYLSFATGLVVMVVCFTGAVLVFEEELQHAFHKDRYYVPVQGKAMSTDAIIASFEQQLAGSKVQQVKWFAGADRSVEISFVQKKKEEKKTGDAKPAAGNNEARKTAFVNPYTGQLIELYNYRDTFFYTMMALHRWLLGEDIGKMIVGVCTILFLVILITGLILWWPKTRLLIKQRLSVKWTAGFKRLNHDFHIVFGFYSLIFLFVFGFTGLAWSFEWFNKGIYTVTNSSMERPKPPKSDSTAQQPRIAAEQALQTGMAQLKDAAYYNLALPKDSTDVFTLTALTADAPHNTASDQLFIDQYKGQVIKTNLYKDRNLGQRVRSTFKPVHTGAIFGWPGKIISVIVCLFGVSFPITGTIMWWNRTRKKRA